MRRDEIMRRHGEQACHCERHVIRDRDAAERKKPDKHGGKHCAGSRRADYGSGRGVHSISGPSFPCNSTWRACNSASAACISAAIFKIVSCCSLAWASDDRAARMVPTPSSGNATSCNTPELAYCTNGIIDGHFRGSRAKTKQNQKNPIVANVAFARTAIQSLMREIIWPK